MASTSAAEKRLSPTEDVSSNGSIYDRVMDRIVKDEKKLSIPCRPVTDDENVDDIIEDLKYCAGVLNKDKKLACIGLAANQIGYDVRIFVVIKKNGKFKAYVNPEVLGGSGKYESVEGCFSFPGRTTKVTRFNKINIRYKGGKGSLKGLEAAGFQHELDHLNGVTISEPPSPEASHKSGFGALMPDKE